MTWAGYVESINALLQVDAAGRGAAARTHERVALEVAAAHERERRVGDLAASSVARLTPSDAALTAVEEALPHAPSDQHRPPPAPVTTPGTLREFDERSRRLEADIAELTALVQSLRRSQRRLVTRPAPTEPRVVPAAPTPAPRRPFPVRVAVGAGIVVLLILLLLIIFVVR